MSSSELPTPALDTEPEPERANDAEHDSDLVDRIRRTALGQEADRNSQRSAQLAFDTSLDLDTRMRMIAKLSALEPSSHRAGKKRSWSWLHVPVGILFVFALGAGLTRRVAPPKDEGGEPLVAEQEPPDAPSASPGDTGGALTTDSLEDAESDSLDETTR